MFAVSLPCGVFESEKIEMFPSIGFVIWLLTLAFLAWALPFVWRIAAYLRQYKIVRM